MPETPPRQSKGLLESLTILAASLVAVAHTRLDLFFLDIEEDREHFFSLVVITLVALFCFGIGVVLTTILLVVVFWEEHRLLVMAIMSGFFLVAGVALWICAKNKIKNRPRLFAASLAELRKDYDQLGR